MRVFVSWSGDRSKEMARALSGWLPRVLPLVKTLMSETIPVGTEWRTMLMKRLRTCDAAIACLTPENLSSQWLNFEAGAAAIMAEYKLFPLFLGEEDIPTGPLSGLQVMRCDESHLRHLVKRINALCEPHCTEGWVDEQFNLLWKELKKEIGAATNTFVDYDEAMKSVRQYLADLRQTTVDAVTFYVRDDAAPEEAVDYYIEAALGLQDPAPMYGPVVSRDFRKQEAKRPERFIKTPKGDMEKASNDKIEERAKSFIGRENIRATATFRQLDHGVVKALLNLNWRSVKPFSDAQKSELREYAKAVFSLLPRRPSISLERARLLTRELRARRHLETAELGRASLTDKIRRTLEQFFQSDTVDIEIIMEDDPMSDPNREWVRQTKKPLFLKLDEKRSRAIIPMRVPPGLDSCKGIIVISDRPDRQRPEGSRTLTHEMVRPLCSLGDTFGGM